MDGFVARKANYLIRIWELRYFWCSLVRNDLDNRYKRSFLGIGWSLVRPLAMTAIFCLVFGNLFGIAVRDYAPHLLIGMTIWQFLSESLLQGCSSFVRGTTYIRQQRIPLAIYPLRTVLGAGFHFLVALTMGIAFTWIFRGSLDPVALFALIPAILVLFLLGWFFAIISGLSYTHFPDTSHLLEIGLQGLFFVTPILLKPETISTHAGRLAELVEWNPLTSILALIRTPILEGSMPALHHYVVSLVFLGLIGIAASVLLKKIEPTLIFWI